MHRFLKTLFFSVVCLASTAVLFAQTQTVRIAALKGPTGLGMIKLFQEKPELAPSVQSEYFAFASPDILLPRLLNGEIDVAALPANLAVNIYNRKVPYALAAIIGNGVLYCVSTDPKIEGLESLAGTTLQNVAKGSTPEFILRHILEVKGLKDTVTVVYKYAPMELAQVLIAGREKTGVLPEPFATKVLRARPEAHIVCDFQEEWKKLYPDTPVYPMTALVVKIDFLKSHPDLVKKFLSLYQTSQDWVKKNPEEAGVLAESLSFGIEREDAKEAIPRCNLTYIPAKEAKFTMERFLNILLQFAPESIGGKLPDDGFYAVP
ncbi:MAG TPA: ABC transporter substrate-binding protein [Spirochaetales bacterium]|nr:ABC transporter substrate-binding protein [Spirochaetales bacterium]